MTPTVASRLHLRLQEAFDETYKRVLTALKAAGFDILSEVDLQDALARRVDGRIKPNKVVFVFHAELTHRALTVAPEIGFRMIHPVAVSQTLDDQVEINAADPMGLLRDQPEGYLRPIVEELYARLEQAVEALKA
ncbi:MAG: DUF302 domain-containing protein [Anaerolineae bacterium]|nr:DUF302 domain-containing protein [Anaerolineae bacterium]